MNEIKEKDVKFINKCFIFVLLLSILIGFIGGVIGWLFIHTLTQGSLVWLVFDIPLSIILLIEIVWLIKICNSKSSYIYDMIIQNHTKELKGKGAK